MAAGRDDDRLGAEPHAGRDCLVGGRVARVQADEQVDWVGALVGRNRGRLEAGFVVAKPRGDRPHGLDHLWICIEPDKLDARADLATVGNEGEAHVSLAAAGIDDANALALPDRQRAQQLDVVLHLSLLVAADLRRLEERMVGRQRVHPGAVMLRRRHCLRRGSAA